MILIQPNIFIQVKAAHFFPGQTGSGGQEFKRVELRRAGGKDDADLVL